MKPLDWRSMMSCADHSWGAPGRKEEASAQAMADGLLRRAPHDASRRNLARRRYVVRALRGSRSRLPPGPDRTGWSRWRLGQLSAQAYQSQQHLVSLASELRDGTMSSLLQRSVDDGLFELRRKLRIAEIFPAAGHGAGKIFHEVANPARPSAEMKQQIRAHDSPAQPGPPANSSIRSGNVDYVLIDETGEFSIERRLQPIRHVAGNFLADMDRLLPDRRIERNRLLNRFWRGLWPSGNLDQRNDVGRIQRMADDAAFGMLAGRLHDTHRQPR